MVCQVSTITPIINVSQPFAGMDADLKAAINAELGGNPRCKLEFAGGFLPSPLWPGMSSPDWELSSTLSNLEMEGMKTIWDQIIGTITSIVPELPLPEVPGIPGLTLDGMFPIDYASIIPSVEVDISVIKAAIADVVPDPIYGEMDSPKQSIMDYIQAAINKYMSMLGTFVLDLIQLVIDLATELFEAFELPIPDFGWPLEMPSLPTLDDLLAVIPSFDIPGLNAFSIPFPLIDDFSLGWPFPLAGNTDAPSYDFSQALKSFPAGFSKAFMNVIIEFWDSLIGIVADVLFLPPLLPTPQFLPIPVAVGKEVPTP